MAMLRISAPQGVSLDYTTQQMRRDRAADPAAARFRRDREHLRQCRPGRLGQQRLHGDVAGALGQARALAAGDHGRDQRAAWPQVPGVRAFPVHAEQPRHPRRRQRPAIRHHRLQQLCRARRRRRNKIVAEMEKDPRFQQPRLSNDATQPQLSVEIDRERASDLGIDITGLSEAVQAMLDGREIDEVFIDDRSLRGEAGLDHQSDQRSDRSREHLPEDDGRPLRAAVDDRDADRTGGAAVAGARAAAAFGRRSPPNLRPDFALGDALTRAAGDRRRRCCRPAAASSRSPKPPRSAKATAAC